MYLALIRDPAGVSIAELDADGSPILTPTPVDDVAATVRAREQPGVRWVWNDTSVWYPPLLAAGVRVERCVDLRLTHAILRASTLTASSRLARAPRSRWDDPTPEPRQPTGGLFEVEAPDPPDDVVAEFAAQRAAIAASSERSRLSLLIAAESAGALVAAELRFAGLPWRRDRHEALLERLLGPRPVAGQRPATMQAALDRLRGELGSDDVNPDSPPELLKALQRAGIPATSTRSWDLERLEHPAMEPLLEYKKLARLASASGWQWLDANVVDGRFHPDYVPGGVVTGRWASKGGGGALQLPRQVRGAVVADPGWTLVVADAAQLEPRILAALAGDRAMAEAGAAGDLYAGIVAAGAVDSRDHAKVAMLGAKYGATTGESGRLLPRLARAFPRAIALVEEAARAGERGEIVTTRLGRSSPPGISPGYDETASAAEQQAATARSRSWGRFTRNFVVQGTAAEWALCWMAGLRGRLRALGPSDDLRAEPHLVFFLHDELVVHSPTGLADRVADALREAALDAGRLLFGEIPVPFPVTVAVVDDYAQAK
ncbi:MAG: hypothetical protein RI885_1928 [Actinomycetota bacterium]